MPDPVMPQPAPTNIPDTSGAGGWPIAGGATGALIRAHDWSATPLGPIAGWSAALRTTVSNIVNSPVPKVLLWGADHVTLYNDGYAAIAGTRHPAALGVPVAQAMPEVWDWNRGVLARGLAGEVQSFHDQPLVVGGGDAATERLFDLFYTPVRDADGGVAGVMGTVIDNTARIMLERAVATREAELRTVTDALPMLVSFIDRDHVFRFANRAYLDWFGQAAEQVVGQHARTVIGEENYALRAPLMDRALAGEVIESDASVRRRDGSLRRANVRYLPRRDADGSVAGFQVLVFDVEDRARREAALHVSNARFGAAVDAMHGVLWTNDPDGRMQGDQPGWAALTGQSIEEYQGYGWSAAVHPDDAGPTVAAWQAAVASKSTFAFEHRVRHRDGAWRNFMVRAVPLLEDGGEISEWVGVQTDITHRRAAEAALRDHASQLERQIVHRRRAEEQLRQLNETLEARVIDEIATRRRAEVALAQAQKMETMGKLTGGVAHDFNNLLQVVSGNLQLLARDLAGDERAAARIGNAMAGVARGSKLASQLLAFGRRQALEPRVVNATRIVRDMDDMLRRALGEGIEIETIVGGGLWNTFIDPVQIENAILNLAINARDAMEGQGRLTIEMGNAHLDDAYALAHDEVVPGQYVMLAVTDTGTGMSPEIIEKVFEPFFSTKGEGKGSGLGLSMVYGFVKQSGGHVKIYSEPRHGTTIRLYLPRALGAEDVEVQVDTVAAQGGSETVLVVEDDAEVRATVVDLLTDLGYRVLKAVDAQSALNVVESGVAIDVLFTDVVMPGTLKSPELARMARKRLPNVAVLFTSGYTENAIVHGGRLDAGVDLLSKPYTREALARKIRQVLANRRNDGGVTGAEATGAGATVLLVEDDPLIRATAADMLRQAGHGVIEVDSTEAALVALETAAIDVLVTDIHLPGHSGLELAERAAQLRPGVRIVIASGDTSAIVAPPVGAILLPKPYDGAALHEAVRVDAGEPGGRG